LKSPLPQLPIDARLPEILAAVRAGRHVILEAPPGTGKTTRVPPALLEVVDPATPHVLVLEPRRLAARLAAARVNRQVDDERRLAEAIREARARFRARHDDHSATVLDNIDRALIRVTRNNPNLLIAYYDYYADSKLTDELENVRQTGATSSGDTDLNPRVLELNSRFPTSDPLSLLGSTLIHEFVHTPQGGRGTVIEQARHEAKAYAIEVFLAERMGDEQRADVIYHRYRNDSVDMGTGSDKMFRATYNTIRALYQVIDSGRTQSDARIAGDVSSEEARRLSVEFISRNEEDYGPGLRDFIARLPR
jgi:hypothetical protein